VENKVQEESRRKKKWGWGDGAEQSQESRDAQLKLCTSVVVKPLSSLSHVSTGIPQPFD